MNVKYNENMIDAKNIKVCKFYIKSNDMFECMNSGGTKVSSVSFMHQ